MGVKINKVKDKKTLEEITVQACEAGYDGEFICISDGCNAQMSFVTAYEQRRLEKIIEVPSFFRLKSNEEHAYGKCPYNTKGAVEVIARESDNNILKALDNNKYEFSLQVLHKPNIPIDENCSNESHDADATKPKKGKKYIRKSTASNYIKALAQILTLRARLEDNNELAPLITLNYRNKKIKWDNFYFELDDYAKAYHIADNMDKPYPMCFHGVISKVIPATKHFKYPKIKVYSPHIELEDDLTPIPSLEFPISDNSLDLEMFSVGTEVLVYGAIKTSNGDWIPPKQVGKDNPKKIRFLSMSTWINHAEQIVKL